MFDTKDLVTLNLKYGTAAKPLKILAFAQLSAKALFQTKKLVKISQITSDISNLIGVNKISENLVKEGLDYLLEMNKVHNNDGFWSLSDIARKEIYGELELSRNLLNKVLKANFPSTLEENNLKNWFKEASADFFGCFGDEWVAAVSKQTKNKSFKGPKVIEEMLAPSIKKHNFGSNQQILIESFTKFISSENSFDLQYLFLISQAIFSSRLVAADIGVDPIALEELQNCKLILDTNILFSISLEHSKVSTSINSLEEALKTIKCKLVYLYSTEEEYGRALNGKRGITLHLVNTFPDEIIKDTHDDFIATAKKRACVTKEDYDRFFDSLVQVPRSLSNEYPIIREDYADIEKIRKIAENDTKLKSDIQKYSLKTRPKWKGPKSEVALNHDATLLHVAEFFRDKQEKCWLLTMDRSLQMCAINRTGPAGIPVTLDVSALIEMLALNNGGPEMNATNFAPLLASIILKECLPPTDTYVIHDLTLLNKIKEKAAELPAVYIKKMLREIVKARVEGNSPESTSLSLKINRMFQESLVDVKKTHEEAQRLSEAAREEVRIAREETGREKIQKEEFKEQAVKLRVKEIKRNALLCLIGKLVIYILVAALISGIIIYLCFLWFDKENKQGLLIDTLTIIIFLASVWKFAFKPALNYKKSCQEAEQVANDEICKSKIK